jgi:hypothetical protein
MLPTTSVELDEAGKEWCCVIGALETRRSERLRQLGLPDDVLQSVYG